MSRATVDASLSTRTAWTDGQPYRPRFAWCEITGECQLKCDHCYAESGPGIGHGPMTTDDWLRTFDQLADAGVEDVQLIGGEPTLHPDFTTLVRHALGTGVTVEVFSNLARTIRTELWDVFTHPRVRVATSYYSDNPAEHDAITNGRNAWAKTTAAIRELTTRGVELRVGLIDITDGQRVEAARETLVGMGVRPEHIGYDRLRGVGRGRGLMQIGGRSLASRADEFCGQCVQGVVAVFPDGHVGPCVFARTGEFALGNIRNTTITEILDSPRAAKVLGELTDGFAARSGDCLPDCMPMSTCSPPCAPSKECGPQSGCGPQGWCGPAVTHAEACFPDAECTPKGGCRPYNCEPMTRHTACYPDHQCGPNYVCGPINCVKMQMHETVEVETHDCGPYGCGPEGQLCGPDASVHN